MINLNILPERRIFSRTPAAPAAGPGLAVNGFQVVLGGGLGSSAVPGCRS